MNVREAAEKIVSLLNEIEAEGIAVSTEDCEQIFLLRSTRQKDQSSVTEFEHISDHAGEWSIR